MKLFDNVELIKRNPNDYNEPGPEIGDTGSVKCSDGRNGYTYCVKWKNYNDYWWVNEEHIRRKNNGRTRQG